MLAVAVCADRSLFDTGAQDLAMDAFAKDLGDFLMAAAAGIGNIVSKDSPLGIRRAMNIMGTMAVATNSGMGMAGCESFSMNRVIIGSQGFLFR